MIIKGIIDEDFVNYRKPSMTIMMPYCSFKCDKEYGTTVCQNNPLRNMSSLNVAAVSLVNRYIINPITNAIVFQGLEPLDSEEDLLKFISELRGQNCYDDIVIFTGYNKDEIMDKINLLKDIGKKNIILKYGRFIPNQTPHYDDVLGINLASDNQYAEKIC